MKRKQKYKLKIYDETHLVDRGGFSISRTRIALFIAGLLIAFTCLGVLIVCFTPIHRWLPGYMRNDQRVRTEEAYMRVDSLQQLYRVHQAYLDNIVKLLDTDREPDLPDTAGNARPLIPDSLMVSSEIEKEFMKKMEEAGYIIAITKDYEEESDGK